MKKVLFKIELIVFLLGLLAISMADGLRLDANDRESGDKLGFCVDISNNLVVAGAPSEGSDGMTGNGAVYIFQNQNGAWKQTVKLHADDKDNGDQFGRSVAIESDIIVVGSSMEDSETKIDNGAAYVFIKNDLGEWVQVTKLLASTPQADSYFGSAVAISDSIICISAPYEDIDGKKNCGAVYIFKQITGQKWAFVTKLIADDKESGDFFGYSIALSDEYLLVGSPFESSNEYERNGKVYVYKKNIDDSWTQTQKVLEGEYAYKEEKDWGYFKDNYFGISLSISGETAVIGANFTAFRGRAYVYELESEMWKLKSRHLPSEPSIYGRFGNDVAIVNSFIIAGQMFADGNGATKSGQSTLLKLGVTGSWGECDTLRPNSASDYDAFGNAVALNNSYAVVGCAAKDNNEKIDCGAVYIYELPK